LDSFEFPEEKVDFVKIDVEGFERYVLAGALAFFRRAKPDYVFIESFRRDVHDWTTETRGGLGISRAQMVRSD
jgi:hypothetical protein